MITSFDKTNLKTLRQDINAALAEVSKKHGINIEFGTIRFSGNQARTKLTMETQGRAADVAVLKSVGLNLASACKMFNINADARGPKGERLVDYVPSRPKYPFTYETIRGTRYKCSQYDASRMFA